MRQNIRIKMYANSCIDVSLVYGFSLVREIEYRDVAT